MYWESPSSRLVKVSSLLGQWINNDDSLNLWRSETSPSSQLTSRHVVSAPLTTPLSIDCDPCLDRDCLCLQKDPIKKLKIVYFQRRLFESCSLSPETQVSRLPLPPWPDWVRSADHKPWLLQNLWISQSVCFIRSRTRCKLLSWFKHVSWTQYF